MRAWRYKSLWLVATIIVTVAATLALLLPPPLTPEMPVSSDYTKHLIGFFLLALWYFGLFEQRRWTGLLIGLCAYGAAAEVVQQISNLGREGDVLDAIANMVGVALGWLTARLGGDRWPVLAESIMARLW